jgi:Domain of unknown function (DUF4269)
VTDDWYQRLHATGLLDVLAPYQPALVGVYPLGIAPDGAPVEIVCRAVDLQAFARVLENTYGDAEGFALYGGRLEQEQAVFAEFSLDGLPLEVSAQREHLHRRLGAATLGISRALEQAGPVARARLAQAVAGGSDWLEAAESQLSLSRSGLESLANANPALVARVMGVPRPGPKLREYTIAITVAVVADLLIVAAGATRGSQEYTGLMFMLEAGVLGLVFGARVAVTAALAPLAAIGLLILSSIVIGSETCSPDCSQQAADYLFVGVIVGSAAGVLGLLRDRYFPRPA